MQKNTLGYFSAPKTMSRLTAHLDLIPRQLGCQLVKERILDSGSKDSNHLGFFRKDSQIRKILDSSPDSNSSNPLGFFRDRHYSFDFLLSGTGSTHSQSDAHSIL